jgi:hypothetical protein
MHSSSKHKILLDTNRQHTFIKLNTCEKLEHRMVYNRNSTVTVFFFPSFQDIIVILVSSDHLVKGFNKVEYSAI